jgi:predicted  nucleic acid-binding Zn-ribbon protein
MSEGTDPKIINFQERLMKAEWKIEEQDKRLSQGAGTFSDIRSSIAELKEDVHSIHNKFEKTNAKWAEMLAPKPIPVWKVVTGTFGIFVFVGSLIWAFARYPDRDEYEEDQTKTEQAQKRLEEDLDVVKEKQSEIKADQRLIKESVERQEKAQESIDTKLDQLLQPTRGRRRR